MTFRHRYPSLRSRLLALAWLLAAPAWSAAPPREIVFYAAEQLPYISPRLPNGGYVSQMVTKAFERAGYKPVIQFYPPKRAMMLAATGAAAGFLPMYANTAGAADFVLSRPFSGNRLALLKRGDVNIRDLPERPDSAALSRNLNGLRFGYVMGESMPADLNTTAFRINDVSSSDLQSLDKLYGQRLDLILIDKLAAGDLMVKERPHYIGKLKVIAEFPGRDFYIGFPKKGALSAKLKADFDRELQEMEDDGTLADIMQENGIYPARSEDKSRKIVIGTPNNAAMLTMRKLADAYQKQHPDITLEWRIMDEKTLRVRQLTDLAVSDNQFDVMTIGAYETPIWARNGWLAPIDSLSPQYDLEDVIESVRAALSAHGVLYGLPFYAESSMTYYRKDLLEKRGLTMPDAPTYADIRRLAAALHDPAHQMYGLCLRGDAGWGSNIAFFATMVNTAGGRWFDEKWNPTVDTPAWHLALQTYKDLLTQYGPPKPGDNNYQRNLNLFRTGHCGIWIDATVFAGLVMDPRTSAVSDKVAFTRSPVLVTPKGSHWLWTWAFSVPKSSKNAAEAMKFIEWATSRDYIELVAKTDGWLNVPPGTRTSTYNNPLYRAAAPFADAVLRSIREVNPNDASLLPRPYSGVQYVSIPEFVSIGDKMGQLVNDVLTGKLTVDDALKQGQDMTLAQMRASKYLH